MLTIWGRKQATFCDGLSRRGFLRAGALGFGGLTLADLLQLRARAAVPPQAPRKAVIMIELFGGPSHIDMYDMKPDAPIEIRGEFKPIQTNVPGLDICELLPLQAKLADKMAVLRMKFNPSEHSRAEFYTGFGPQKAWPPIGAFVSKLRQDAGIRHTLPPYVALGYQREQVVTGGGFLGSAHQAFLPNSKTATALELTPDVSLDRLADRRALMQAFDGLHRELDDSRGSIAGADAFTAQALELLTNPKARAAFDLTLEPDKLRARYGKATHFLAARRLVEAGVPLVACPFPTSFLHWDTHSANFKTLRQLLPSLDQALTALVTDLHERGLDQDVAVVVGGEMGRTPRIGGNAGRDHWGQAGFMLVIGGGLQMGQAIGASDAHAATIKGQPYTPQNVLATLYRVLGIDIDQATVLHPNGRSVHLLEDCRPIKELF